MVEHKNLTNLEIFNYANDLIKNFDNTNNYNFPVKINFYLQKNMSLIVNMARDIESNRIDIIKKYGIPSTEDPEQYVIDNDKLADANKELTDLFDLSQEVNINMLNLDWFDGIDLTPEQVHAISFMIAED